MGTVYALLVGVDGYRLPLDPLFGCRNDIEAVREYLRGRVTTGLKEETLLDVQATRGAVVDAFRDHLGQAGPGDVALFWWSGHGSQQPVAPELWFLEPSGLNQTVVCVDSRTRDDVPDLADKELSVLIAGVAGAGAHTVIVLDCCHSGGGTREPLVSVRGVERAAQAPPLTAMLPELQARARDGSAAAAPVAAPHVGLFACRSFETAKEQPVDGRTHGVFTASLLTALRTLPPGGTYRDLLTAARCRVENVASDQVPELTPPDAGGLVDQPFLGGAVSRPVASFVLRSGRDGWEVDAGLCHGIPPPVSGDPVLFAVPAGEGSEPARLVRVTGTEADRSLVDPVGWQADPGRQYPVVVASVPLPAATVVVGGRPDDDVAAGELLANAIATAGPAGGPSPLVRVVPPEDASVGLRMRVAAPAGNGDPAFRILRGDGTPATTAVPGHSEESARVVVSRLEHIARWTQIKNLENPGSGLAGAVTLEIVQAEPGDVVVPQDREPLGPDEHGEIRLSYRLQDDAWVPPAVFLRIRNGWRTRLYCVLLDLTDRFRVHPKLFPGDFVGPGQVGAGLEGRPTEVTLPPGRAVAPGAVVRDWFKLLVSEEEFSSLAFELPRLDEPPSRGATAVTPKGVLDRLGLRATARDADRSPEPAAGADWTTSIVPVVTVVPDA